MGLKYLFNLLLVNLYGWMVKKIRYPCNHYKCHNTKFLEVVTAKYHLVKHGLISNYFVWTFQGERIVRVDIDQDIGGAMSEASEEAFNAYHTMVLDVVSKI